jgi:hypothetical protein
MCLGSPPPFSFSFKFSEALYSNSRRSSRDMCHIDNKSIRSHDSDGVQVNSCWAASNSFLERGGPRDRRTLIQYKHAGSSWISHPIFSFEVPRGGPRKSSFHWYDSSKLINYLKGRSCKGRVFLGDFWRRTGDQALLNCTHKLFFLFVENSLTSSKSSPDSSDSQVHSRQRISPSTFKIFAFLTCGGFIILKSSRWLDGSRKEGFSGIWRIVGGNEQRHRTPIVPWRMSSSWASRDGSINNRISWEIEPLISSIQVGSVFWFVQWRV